MLAALPVWSLHLGGFRQRCSAHGCAAEETTSSRSQRKRGGHPEENQVNENTSCTAINDNNAPRSGHHLPRYRPTATSRNVEAPHLPAPPPKSPNTKRRLKMMQTPVHRAALIRGQNDNLGQNEPQAICSAKHDSNDDELCDCQSRQSHKRRVNIFCKGWLTCVLPAMDLCLVLPTDETGRIW